MERAWQRRGAWREMGARAGQRVRATYSSSPDADFASLLEQVANGREIRWQRDWQQAVQGEAA
jgi:hypothetical protein